MRFERFYLKVLPIYKMNAEELLQDIEEDDKHETKGERLSAIVAGGGSKQYLGKEFQMSEHRYNDT